MTTLHLRIEDQITRARRLHDLGAWISCARNLADSVMGRASRTPALAEQLEGIPIGAAAWDEMAQAGLEYLQLTITELLLAIEDEVSDEFATVKAPLEAAP